MHVKLIGRASLVGDRVDVRVGPAFVDGHHPLAAVEGAFNAVMLQGDAIREITLEGPGAGGIETASAVVADMVSVVGTTGTGFLQNDPVWRNLERLEPGDLASPFYLRLEVEDRAGVLARIAQELADQEVSVAQLVQQPGDGHAVLHVVTHEATAGRVKAALDAIRALARGPRRGQRDARHLGPRRRGARLGMTIALIDRFRDRLPVSDATPVVSLGEGSTPLLRAPRLSERFGAERLVEVGGVQPDGLLQGPRHDRRSVEGG